MSPSRAGGPGCGLELAALGELIRPAVHLGSRSAGIGVSLGWTLLAIARSVALTVGPSVPSRRRAGRQVVGASVAGMLHRSAVFLVVFLVIHMLGNLTFLVGDDAFNQYGHKLEALRPATTAIELYLLAAAVIHAGTAMMASWRKRAVLLKPSGRWGLAVSSIAVSAFLVVHVSQFR